MRNISIKNFQSHKKTKLVIENGLTSIIGDSDSGKSSIIRAIKWFAVNKPSGVSFIREGTTTSIIDIDGILRVRSEKRNEYILDKKIYRALRGSVPDEIVNKLNLNEYAIQMQHDSIFLLGDTPGVVAKKLSNLIDLEEPIRALQIISSEKQDTSVKIKSLKLSVEREKQTVEKLKEVPKAITELSTIEQKAVKFEKQQQMYSEVCILIKNVKEAAKRLNSMPSKKALPAIKLILHKYEKIEQVSDTISDLDAIISYLEKYNTFIAYSTNQISQSAKRLIRKLIQYDNLCIELDNLSNLKREIKLLIKKHTELTAKRSKVLKRGCPLCGK